MEPKNPQQIIVQNNFYPHGISEADVWNHYQKNKNIILNEVRSREVIFFLAVDLNKTVVMRKYEGKPIRLTNQNYDFMIGGRTLSIHSTMNSWQKFGILDLDIVDFRKAKDAVEEVFPIISHAPFINDVKIRFTGKTSFHLVCYFKKEFDINDIRMMLKNYLTDSTLSKEFDIGYGRRAGIVNIDLTINKIHGGHIAIGSLSTIGLQCMELELNKLKYFRREMAKTNRRISLL